MPATPGECRALQRRLRDQGWDQGCHLDDSVSLFLASRQMALTEDAEASRPAEEGNQYVVIAHRRSSPGMIIASQICDLLHDPRSEPFIEAIPLVAWPPTEALPGMNSPRFFLVDAAQRLVADQRYRIQLEKTLIPDRSATQLLANEEAGDRFRSWLGRRFSRSGFPDDFNLLVGKPLQEVIDKTRRKHEAATSAMHSWRARLVTDSNEDSIGVYIIGVWDERRCTEGEASQYRHAVESALNARMKKAVPEWPGRRFAVYSIAFYPMDQATLRHLYEFPPLDLDHLSFAPDDDGIRPREDSVK